MNGKYIHSEHLHERAKGKYIGDLVYGANDGIITTFSVVSGAAGAALSPGAIIVLGLASLIADGISMGLSNYLALKSRLEYQKQERKREEHEIEEFPDIERSEVLRILEGLKIPEPAAHTALVAITSDKKRWIDFMMKEELNIIEDGADSPAKHGVITFFAFVLAGFLPLIPFLLGASVVHAFSISVVATGASLFIVGALRTLATGAKWFSSGLQMLGVGILAAVAAYVVGGIVKDIFGIKI